MQRFYIFIERSNYMPEKQTNKERLKDITDSIEKGIQELFQKNKYAQ